jgi:hypothetical protein
VASSLPTGGAGGAGVMLVVGVAGAEWCSLRWCCWPVRYGGGAYLWWSVNCLQCGAVVAVVVVLVVFGYFWWCSWWWCIWWWCGAYGGCHRGGW